MRGEPGKTFHPALLEKLRIMAVTTDDEDPGHKFLIGLAYLDGIDVEVDAGRAVELITEAAVQNPLLLPQQIRVSMIVTDREQRKRQSRLRKHP